MTSISLGTINADRSPLNIVGGNQVNQYTDYHIYPPLAAGYSNRQPVNNAPFDLLSVHFTGRRKELEFLQDSLTKSHSGTPKRCAVHGMPGIGKTQLLLRYAKVSWDQNLYPCIFWISATSLDKINQGISGILDLVEHPDRYLQDQSAKLTAARLWLEKSSNDEGGDWLLIFDNVHRETLSFLRIHLPLRNDRGSILFSTRTEDVAGSLVNAAGERRLILGLQAPDLQETTNLLFDDAGIDAKMVTPSLLGQAEDLVKRVGCLPLAVVQAASFMKQTHTTLDLMLELYKNERKMEVIQWENDLTPYEARSVAGTFENQLNELKQHSRDISNLLKFLSFLDPENIPVKMIVDGAETRLHQPEKAPPRSKRTILQKVKAWRPRKKVHTTDAITGASHISHEFDSLIAMILSPIEFQTALQKLQNMSLVEHRSHNGTSSLWIHDLIHFMVREGAKNEETYEEWLQLSWSFLYGTFCLIEEPWLPQRWADCEMFMPHLQSLNDAWNDVHVTNLEVAHANRQISRYLNGRGRYDEAESLYKRVLDGHEKHLGTDHSDTLMTVNELAYIYSSQGRYEESEVLYNRAVNGLKKNLGTSHPDTLSSMTGLALVYSSQGRYDKSETLHKLALEGYEKHLGTDHPQTLISVDNLALAYASQGRYAESEALHKRSLEGQEKCLGTDHRDTLIAMNNLAHVYLLQGRYEESEVLYNRAVDGLKKNLGTSHPDTLSSMTGLAFVYSSQGRYDKSETLYKRALEGYAKHLGTDHPQTLISVDNLALVYASQGRYAESEALHKRSLEGQEKCLGTDHRDTLIAVNNLAHVYLLQGRYEESEVLYNRAVNGLKKNLGTSHPDTISSITGLASVYSSQGRFGESEALLKPVLEEGEKYFGIDHPLTVASRNILEFVYSSQGRSDEAEALRRRAPRSQLPREDPSPGL